MPPHPANFDPVPETMEWFCIRSQIKHEHIAEAHLQKLPGVEAFNPRIRFRRPTRKGPAWVVESLFPNYLFAKFNWHEMLKAVRYARGVAGIIHFGDRWPTIPNPVIRELMEAMGNTDLLELDAPLEPGDAVEVSGGAFHGLHGVVTRYFPARQRVSILLDFLGRQTAVELPTDIVVADREHPLDRT